MYKSVSYKFFFIFCIFVFECIAKTFESVPFICADEVGPTLEFSIPKFKEDQKQDKISFKIYDSENRKSFNIIEGNVEKKSSPIDTSYFFYNVKTLNKNDMQEINFQFFPPSHLLLQKKNSQFTDQICWIDK